MRRRDFVILLAGALGGRPSAVRAQQMAMPTAMHGIISLTIKPARDDVRITTSVCPEHYSVANTQLRSAVLRL
jgi:hypothetical protein